MSEGKRLRADNRKLREALDSEKALTSKLTAQMTRDAIEGLNRPPLVDVTRKEAPERPMSHPEWEIHWAFYRLTVNERDHERREVNKLREALDNADARIVRLEEREGGQPGALSHVTHVWLVHCNNALLEVCRFRSGAETRAKAERALIGGVVANVVVERHEVTGA